MGLVVSLSLHPCRATRALEGEHGEGGVAQSASGRGFVRVEASREQQQRVREGGQLTTCGGLVRAGGLLAWGGLAGWQWQVGQNVRW